MATTTSSPSNVGRTRLRPCFFKVNSCGLALLFVLSTGAWLCAQEPANLTPGQQQAQSAQQSAPASPVAQNIPIGPGDLLDVEVFNTPELSARLRVDQQGRVTLPLGGDVDVKGLKVAEAAKAIEQRLISANIMLQPTVIVSIVEYATEGVTVLGEVKSPGIYTLLGPHSLYDALASAGGPSTSEGSTITITHADDAEHPINIPVTTPNYSAIQKSTIVRPGDTIVVSRAELVYIVGDMSRSGAFYIQNGQPLTVLDLVSLAQGPNRTALMSHTAIIRQKPDGTVETIRFDLNKVMRAEERNLVLKGGDVLVVPRSGWKTFAMTAIPALTNAASSAVLATLLNQ
jgi:polysaccharide export outer membrane protein